MFELKYLKIPKGDCPPSYFGEQIDEIKRNGEYVEDPDKVNATYTISEINSRDKWTEHAVFCIVSLLQGQNINSSRVSLLAHATPAAFNRCNNEDTTDFIEKYADMLRDFATKTIVSSRTAFAAGGIYTPFWKEGDWGLFDPRRYAAAVKTVARMNRIALGVETLTIPPKKEYGKTNIYLNNDRQIVHVTEQQNASKGMLPTLKEVKLRPVQWFLV